MEDLRGPHVSEEGQGLGRIGLSSEEFCFGLIDLEIGDVREAFVNVRPFLEDKGVSFGDADESLNIQRHGRLGRQVA